MFAYRRAANTRMLSPNGLLPNVITPTTQSGQKGRLCFSETPLLSTGACPATSNLRYNRLIIGMTGATGAIYGIKALQFLRDLGVETHLVMSKWAHATIKYETPWCIEDVANLATGRNWSIRDMSAPMSSGSWKSDGMLIAPCSVKTLAAIRAGYAEDLISRSADVCIKERRPLVLVVRETPLSAIHLENMLELSRLGAIIFPAVPAFYTRPKGLEELVDHSVARMMDCFGIEPQGLMPEEGRWNGFRK
ncbi:Phenylacrylic acid decarboxylase 1, mitochondrial [Talaromyces atroroseus]|uniref:Flavin prenyltransferase PAD1, mitochondrial n=1 Tax=Talaromyces atroroseus TaxID=1441469 RepID=A0A225AA30_TALAT|nr:Phenylacrylic acid decarboxylase 1, mitochondrial [Talaromyces atroroseus]OKL57672.1 Phenylacrylic acid decarboxylase 1, mitochondrial [Talaromyces atroroseus]